MVITTAPGAEMTTRFVVQRDDLRQFDWVDDFAADLADGEVRLRIDAFALTSNNITYATFGDAMNYWGFYPTGDPATGCVPVWGFGSVVDSRSARVTEGERFYGYFPIADDVVLQATAVHPGGFSDGAAHRRELPPIYNQYVRCSADPAYRADREAQQALLRPLFATSFLIDDFLAASDFFGARTVIVSSASSKTGYGTAFCLALRRGSPEAVAIVGLTSSRNLEFTRSLGCYDDVFSYDEIATSIRLGSSIYLDMSGDASVRTAVHERLGDLLHYDCAVGATHWDAPREGSPSLPGPAPVLFFAPAQAGTRVAEWGVEGFQDRLAAAWNAFMDPVTRAHDPWLTVVQGKGTRAIEKCYAALLDGKVPAREGHVLSVH
jgi:Protein of unknown function (DUF2855)